jgi:hypothetical protein
VKETNVMMLVKGLVVKTVPVGSVANIAVFLPIGANDLLGTDQPCTNAQQSH